MLYPTVNQLLVFVVLFAVGIASGFLFDIANLLTLTLGKNKIIRQILYFFATFLSFFAYFLTNLAINFGQFRVFTVASFLMAIILERTFISIPLCKLFNKIWQKVITFFKNKNMTLKKKKAK